MEQAHRFGLERLFELALLLIGIGVAAVSWDYGFGSLARPGPGLYPFFVGVAIAVFSLFTLLSGLRSAVAGPVLNRERAMKLVLMSATFCLWILAMPVLGYVIVTLLATFAFCKIMKLEGWWKPLAVSAGTALFIFLLFDYWLYVDLPTGILG